jgi:hypothetical protein
MWKALVTIVKRCLRTAFGKPGAKRETRVQNPPAEYDEQAALEYAQKLIAEFLCLFEQWKAGTLPPHMLRKPRKPVQRQKRPRVVARPDSVRRVRVHAEPQSVRAPARQAPIPPQYLRPPPLDGPKIFFPRCATSSRTASI